MKEGTENTDKLPDWPQPAGIFKNGKFFNPLAFLQTVQDLYGVVTMSGPGPNEPKVIRGIIIGHLFNRPSRARCRWDGLKHLVLGGREAVGRLLGPS